MKKVICDVCGVDLSESGHGKQLTIKGPGGVEAYIYLSDPFKEIGKPYLDWCGNCIIKAVKEALA